MKKIFLFCFVAIAIVSLTSFQEKTAEFKFVEETHDFGKIPQGKPVSYVFKYTNVGEEPIIISAVESTCGCTVPSVEPKQGTPILKGQGGAITITFNAAVATPFTKFVKITSNSKTPLKMLYIKGEVVAAAAN
ncbi:MAG: DUF1573 domain-containing protein [Sphingobacteriales bacterium]|nr:MAG: DUF1573 domain-containing protein [Sphingobacteriales bacterium]TAF82219.1 MAG: DUF1573 domain-containing protein [Sphingobacteriales bacterium]